MKILLFMLLGGIIFCFPYVKNQGSVGPPAVLAVPTPAADTIRFATQIQPILQNRCNPCHFPGGKMYGKLPFDRAKTILDHQPGVFKRIREEKEVALLRQFFKQSEQVQD